MSEEETIQQFLDGKPRAEQLTEWRVTLEHRMAALDEERKKTGATASLDTKIDRLKRQIEALREEEAVTQFIEDSVRVTLAMGSVSDGMDDPSE